MIKSPNNQEQIYSVSQLNATARSVIEANLPPLWVQGEISNLAQPSSGHIYFSLKDKQAQIRCAMFKIYNHFLDFKPEDGMQVLVQGQVSIYEQRGDYQLIAQYMAPAGEGLLRQKFEELKKQLQAEGLFNLEHKKLLPAFPNAIGIITSPTGAAIRDILSVLKRRFPAIPVIIYPTAVQGAAAKNEIATAIKEANKHNKCELLIVSRGGGSLEDLWPFNEEIVARAIYASKIPIISGVGHETDTTIADFVADVRAPTPSAAAELASPDRDELLKYLQNLANKNHNLIKQQLGHFNLLLSNLTKRLQHPKRILQNQAQIIDGLEQRLFLAMHNLIKHKKNSFINLSRTMQTMSPLKTLERGFAIATQPKEHKIIHSIKKLKPGDKVDIHLKDGVINCEVISQHIERFKNGIHK